MFRKGLFMLWFNVILGLNFIFLCFNLIIKHYRTSKQRKIKFKPRITLNHNIYMTLGQLSYWCEFTVVPSRGYVFVYMIPPQNVMLAQVTPV